MDSAWIGLTGTVAGAVVAGVISMMLHFLQIQGRLLNREPVRVVRRWGEGECEQALRPLGLYGTLTKLGFVIQQQACPR